jgi:peptidoglycan/xylan/chitin deacetylase (PgdA/CDA1 family)
VIDLGLTRRALSGIRRRRAVVLGYHGVAQSRRRDDLSMLLVSPERFRAQVELLLAAGFRFVTLADFVREAGGLEPPAGLAAITFDDGMRNNHEVAWPILAEYSIPATVYVTFGFIDGSSPWISAGGDGAMMSSDQLRELAAAGWELGAHTMTHPDMSTLDYDACLAEIRDSVQALERIAGRAVQTFAYPFGRYGPAAIAAARDAGMIAAVTTGSGSWDPFELTRAMVGAADPPAVMLLKLTDRYEPLLASPPMRAARTASKQLRGRLQQRAARQAA